MITSLRAATLRGGLLLLGLALAGCAGAGTRMAVAPAAPALGSGPLYATVALVRPVPAGATEGEGAVLAALGLAPTDAQGGLSEILLRTDDGHTVSVVAAAAGYAPGARVVLLPGSPLRLGRPGMTAPAS